MSASIDFIIPLHAPFDGVKTYFAAYPCNITLLLARV